MPRKPNTTGEHYNDPFPTRLRELIKDNNTTQEDLTAVLNVKTRQSVTGYIDGSTLPTIDKVVALADFFNVSVDYLLGRTGPKTADPNLRFVCEYTGLTEQAINKLKTWAAIPHALSTMLAADAFDMFISSFLVARDFTFNTRDTARVIEEKPAQTWEDYKILEHVHLKSRVATFDFSESASDLLDEICNYHEVSKDALELMFSISKPLANNEEGENGEYQED